MTRASPAVCRSTSPVTLPVAKLLRSQAADPDRLLKVDPTAQRDHVRAAHTRPLASRPERILTNCRQSHGPLRELRRRYSSVDRMRSAAARGIPGASRSAWDCVKKLASYTHSSDIWSSPISGEQWLRQGAMAA